MSETSKVRHLIVEMQAESAARAMFAAGPSEPAVAGVTFDPGFLPVSLPAPKSGAKALSLGLGALQDEDDGPVEERTGSYIVRAKLAPDQDPASAAEAIKRALADRVVEVFADVPIQPTLICPGSPPLGTDASVEALLRAPALRRRGMHGRGVTVAIVDTGINMAYLNAHGKHPRFDAARSWAPHAGVVPGSVPVDHGTMCAYDVCIAAPSCTLIDIALLQSTTPGSTVMEGLLSDAVRAYRHLLTLMGSPHRPGENRSLVVNNSWGMFQPSWDFPVGHPGNYSENPMHPFNRIVTSLERAGADILFAAGNCGADCPDGRCGGFLDRPIYGANSHPRVLSIAGVDTTKQRVGYSSIGPGRLTRRKPDLCGFTHFAGSGVYAADGGTSAATPVVAGVIAALRTRLPFLPGSLTASPARVRDLLRKTAIDVGTPGYDYKHGYGIVNGAAIAALFPIAAPLEALPEEAAPAIAIDEAHCAECGQSLPARQPAQAPGDGEEKQPLAVNTRAGSEPAARSNGNLPHAATSDLSS